MAQSKVGRVQLMPLPNGTQTGGSWTPEDPAILEGQVEITLRSGTPFVLPLYAWTYERYQGWPAVPDDTPMSNDVALGSGHSQLTIDGRTIITDDNKANFFVPLTYFDPIAYYPVPTSYGSIAATAYQGVTMVSPPLPPGTHILYLYVPLILKPGDSAAFPTGLGMVYVNTWVVTVE